ncbi:MAG TPA: hypothetical protein DEH78_19785 [Solibacterales bacterium]|nr:hypothetical protein [Bryobacterales bacterium]
MGGQDLTDSELAKLLANYDTRAAGVERAVAQGPRAEQLLISWTLRAPSDVDFYQLRLGMADAFARWKTREAIPFLIENIDMQPGSRPNIWMKADSAVQAHFRAVNALIRIGPAAASEVMERFWTLPSSVRLHAVFVVAHVADPDSYYFLGEIIHQANLERYWAAEARRKMGRKQ